MACNLSPKTAPNMSVYRPNSLFQEQLGVTPVTHSNLKTYRTDYQVLENDPTQG